MRGRPGPAGSPRGPTPPERQADALDHAHLHQQEGHHRQGLGRRRGRACPAGGAPGGEHVVATLEARGDRGGRERGADHGQGEHAGHGHVQARSARASVGAADAGTPTPRAGAAPRSPSSCSPLQRGAGLVAGLTQDAGGQRAAPAGGLRCGRGGGRRRACSCGGLPGGSARCAVRRARIGWASGRAPASSPRGRPGRPGRGRRPRAGGAGFAEAGRAQRRGRWGVRPGADGVGGGVAEVHVDDVALGHARESDSGPERTTRPARRMATSSGEPLGVEQVRGQQHGGAAVGLFPHDVVHDGLVSGRGLA